MKSHAILIQLSIVITLSLFTATTQAQTDELTIVGPTALCYPDCATYTVIGPSPPGTSQYRWRTNGIGFFIPNIGQQMTGMGLTTPTYDPDAEMCMHFYYDGGGSYAITITLEALSITGAVLQTQTLTVQAGGWRATPQLVSGGGCAWTNSATACTKVCEGSVVRYEIFPLSAAPHTSWVVQNAESYVINSDNSITVEWGATGAGRILASYSLSECLSDPQQVACVDIVKEPRAVFTTDPPPQQEGVLTVCKGQPVRFINQSQNTEQVRWFLGNNLTTIQNPIGIYDTAGTYEVLLSAYNGCNCTDTATMTIVVQDAFAPNIDCQSTICSGEEVTYRTDADCGNFYWTINGLGTLVSGGGVHDNFITVKWIGGGNGRVELAVENCPDAALCQAKTSIDIPIIAANADVIQGPDRVCESEVATYHIPEFQGILIQWGVTGGTLLSGQGSNKINVRWPVLSTPVQRRVTVSYNNCYLECSSADTLNVFTLPEFYIDGTIEACVGGDSEHKAITGSQQLVNCHWTATDADGIVVWTSAAPSTSVSLNWDQPGIYSIKAVPDNPGEVCLDVAESSVRVFKAPEPPGSILGDTLICPGQANFYRAGETEPGARLHWRIFNGNEVTESSGPTANVTWGATPPFEINLTQTSVAAGCVSEPYLLAVRPIQNELVIAGPDIACTALPTTYTAAGLNNGNFQWTLQPANAGVIIGSSTSASVQVQWNREGQATLHLAFCNINADLPVTVYSPVLPEVVAPTTLCDNEIVQVQTTLPFASYRWKSETGSLISTTATPELPPGYYHLEAVDEYGCASTAVFNINGLPAPKVRISSSSFRCLDLGIPTLYALNTVAGYEYQWLLDDNLLAVTGPIATANQSGTYEALVTDVNGCSARSNPLNVAANCFSGGSGGGEMPLPGGLVQCLSNLPVFQIIPTDTCHIRNYTAEISNSVPGSMTWQFGDPNSGTANNTASGESVTHQFSEAGFYEILVFTNLNQGGVNSTCGALFIDTVWTKANFGHTAACAGDPVLFTDLTTFIPITSITSWHWDFGDTASGAANTTSISNPEHTFNAPGEYTVTLTVTSSKGCKSVYSETITIWGPPALTINLLPAYCENTAHLFMAEADSPPVSWFWNFDLPGGNTLLSGNGIYNSYPDSGTYGIELEAVSRHGCRGSIVENIIVGNDDALLSGMITSSLNIPFCPNETTLLSAPTGGMAWQWSTGVNAAEVGISEAGLYSVTVTDTLGCGYVPPPAIVHLLESPPAFIRAIEYSADFSVLGYHYHNMEICEGESTYLEVVTDAGNQVMWSNGDTSVQIAFSDLRLTQLPEGFHEISVTVTDTSTGCETLTTFSITVHPSPDLPVITSLPTGQICAGVPVTLSVATPDPELLYVWNTGQAVTSITTSATGIYTVTAFNTFGCSVESSKSSGHQQGPNMSLIPSGCYERCNPDTVCVWYMPNVSSYQWYLNGSQIPGATSRILTATESGDYQLRVLHAPGYSACYYYSETLSLSLYDGVSPIGGQVYFDVNNNGQIDPDDTLATNVHLQLLNPDTLAATAVSAYEGHFLFPETGTGMYVIAIDTALLDDEFRAVTPAVDIEHSGCAPWHANLLIGPACTPVGSSRQISLCRGDDFGGIPIATDTTFVLRHTSLIGCDSIESVQIYTLEPSPITLNALSSCQGIPAYFNGTAIIPGSTTDFTFTNAVGCDSIITVTVLEVSASESFLTLFACPGTEADFNGTGLLPGTITDFTLTNSNGCDSVVTVSVQALSSSESTLTLFACPGTEADFNGTSLLPGTITDFTLTNSNGCDSVVTVSVQALSSSESALTLFTCPGTEADFNGTSLLPGTITDFTLTNSNGCDSVVTVSVQALSSSESALTLFTCPGTEADFNGTSLLPGTITDFTFTNSNGCDSIVTVTVQALSSSESALTLFACPGTEADFNGTSLLPGTITDFTLTNSNGCDSIVTVSVVPFSQYSTTHHFSACTGAVVTYNGFDIPAGEQAVFTFPDENGCDSVVLVIVTAFPLPAFHVEVTPTCPNANTGSVDIMDIQNALLPLEYLIDGQNSNSGPSFQLLEAGVYGIAVRDANGCLTEIQTEVPVLPSLILLPEVVAVMPCNPHEISLDASIVSGYSDELNYLWSTGETMPGILVTSPGDYHVAVSNSCETQQQLIQVLPAVTSATDYFYIPNAFSPNADGINDAFMIMPATEVIVEDFKLSIFDRWGNYLFSTSDINNEWDGNFRGRPMGIGVYVWQMEAKVMLCGESQILSLKGDVTLLR